MFLDACVVSSFVGGAGEAVQQVHEYLDQEGSALHVTLWSLVCLKCLGTYSVPGKHLDIGSGDNSLGRATWLLLGGFSPTSRGVAPFGPNQGIPCAPDNKHLISRWQ